MTEPTTTAIHPTTTESPAEFFDRYAVALSAVDLDALAGCYHYPSLAVSRFGCLAITDPEQTRQFFAQNSAGYRRRGIAAVRIGNLSPSHDHDGLWVGLAELENRDADGSPVDGPDRLEHNAYQLVRGSDGRWRIAVTTPLDAR
jgi:hypothetical protein